MVQALKIASALFASLLLGALVTSCGEKDTHQAIMEDTLTLMEEIVAIMESVKDQASADAAAAKLDGLVGKFEQIAERHEAIGKPDQSTEEALEEEFEGRREEIESKIVAAMVVAKDPRIMKPLQKPMDRIGEVMSRVK